MLCRQYEFALDGVDAGISVEAEEVIAKDSSDYT
jgi:hypothetical protein